MRLLVTGGCGFIGANFVYMMLQKHSDVVIVNLDKLTYAGNRLSLAPLEKQHGGKRYHFVHGDIANAELVAHVLAHYQIEAVVNFAAESHVDRSITDATPFVTTNVLGTQVLLDTARRMEIPRFVHVSTDEVYGTLGPTGKFTEETPLAPNSPYSASKASADMLCRAFFETHGFPVAITRCSNNYGPYQFPEKLIPLMILKASRGESLPVYGDGLNVRDWIYVLDHCLGVELTLLKGKPGQAYNFGGNAEKPNIEVVKTILAALGKPESLITYVKDRPGHDRRYAMDYSLAQRELGFNPEYSFEQGIERTLAWYRDNQDWLESVQSGAYRAFMDTWYGERK
ncbi:dTDP-glucose 4,6-dehydratase [Fundidesulfovibrio magnetotacticus]|uniref:dTDP-glucose 4,6-dehydratase n=1 Tax=Fundidesulfovibrio magnetotacticus TaxID=2730080 RepID=A0A6V8LXY5_9BACT|nr:dTDP-glucose 4,6-dehydratase [Fundidesulfovibrio magnetotacticus]GFK93135.1 dTDP-glucose 4,6-dehydratase [Fundidesulfovibrio magnetotacticus]